MAPELVVASSAYTTYPGGVIALRCTDWLGPARGSLTTETDSRAITGECVRDAQTVATSIFTDDQAALQAADDTLVIDLNTLPIEDGMRYLVFGSCLIEGDWDVTDTDTTRGATADVFASACVFAWSFTSDFSGNFFRWVPNSRRRPTFIIGEFETSSTNWDETDTMYLRAIAQDGTTIEWLIDQLFFVPYVLGAAVGQWETEDFAVPLASDGDRPVDGADGGDDNGKFTLHHNPHEAYFSVRGPSSGDYQKDPLDEGIADIPVNIFLLWNSVTEAEAPAHAYSFHGADYREQAVLTNDDFGRTTGPDDWGVDDAGFAWYLSGSLPTTYSATTNGTQGVLNTDAAVGAVGVSKSLAFAGTLTGAAIAQPDYTISGTVEYTAPTYDGAGSPYHASLRWWMSSGGTARSHYVHLDLVNKEWALYYANARVYNTAPNLNNGTQDTKWSSDFDVSSWLSDGVLIGYRIEKRRYRLRVKIWEASGGEPGTWDFDDFLVSDNGAGTLAGIRTYSYLDDLNYAYRARLQGAMFPSVGMQWGQTIEWSSFWDDFEVEYDPVGDGSDIEVTMDGPSTAEEQITVPYGAWQMIYWGTRDWTALSGGDPYVEFTSKTWSETGAAELQRAQALMWWFRSVHGALIPMNWRSADRSPRGQNRILTGG